MIPEMGGGAQQPAAAAPAAAAAAAAAAAELHSPHRLSAQQQAQPSRSGCGGEFGISLFL